MEASKKKVRMGDLLIAEGLVTESQLKLALDEQNTGGKKLGQTLIDLGFVEEEEFLTVQSQQLGMPLVNLKKTDLKESVTSLLPEALARRYVAIPVDREEDVVRVAIADPTDIFGFDEIQSKIGLAVISVLASQTDIMAAIDQNYRNTEEMSSIALELESELGFETEIELDFEEESSETSDAPVVRLIQSIFEEAIHKRASDIHIEPDEKVIRIRQRIDGVLNEQVMKEKRIASALVMRLKIMSGLDISEKRLPQDGRFNMAVTNKKVDVRISTLPTQYGESVVMRILDQSADKLDLKKLGMPASILSRFDMLIRRPHGIILVTGPTGSGKTTTLYSALSELNSAETKIITAEDPVEYRLPRIQQVQVNMKVGLDFTSVLRSALRQDPDIVLVGEIRDKDTTEIALKAAMTGHLVLSTLHTNDAVSSAVRLIDMGAPAYLAASAILAIMAQRLVRRNCENCKERVELSVDERKWLSGLAGTRIESLGDQEFYQGKGCSSCNKTGYTGRIGVYELLEMSEEMSDYLRKDDVAGFSRAAYNNPDFESLAICALRYAMQGITSVGEVFKLASLLDHV